MTRIERIARFATRSIGERVDDVRENFERLFCGPLVGGGYGWGRIEYDVHTRSAKIISDAGIVEIAW